MDEWDRALRDGRLAAPKPSAGPMMVRSRCPVHGVVQYAKRWPHDWALWCSTERPPMREDLWDTCRSLIWVQDLLRNPDGGEPRTYYDVMAEITRIASHQSR
jgi:hypothetical protein